MRPRILVIDDHEHIRKQLCCLLQSDCEIVGEASDGSDAPECVDRLMPDLVLLDISMPVMGGFQAAVQLLKVHPGLAIVFVSQNSGTSYLAEARRIGARGFVRKGAAASSLSRVVQAVFGGEPFVVAA
jgi:DNA-binding NarL/FixJ family response regulator